MANNIPQADRPVMPKDYGVPEGDQGMLPWSWAEERLVKAPNFWVCSTRPDGRPHASPIWGVWVDNKAWFDGSPATRRGRNIANNPNVVVHLESGDEVVIVEGVVEEVAAPDSDLAQRLVEAYKIKYGGPPHNYIPDPANWQNGGLYATHPQTILAWSKFPTDCTRWKFDRDA